MKRSRNLLLSLFAIIVAVAGQAAAQDAQKPSVVMGNVVSVETGKIVLQTKDGQMDIVLTDKSQFKRVPPDNPVLSAAVPAEFGDIGVGDSLVVSGFFGEDKKVLPARSVYLMRKSEISQKQAKESQEWKTRGIAGRVVAVDPVSKQLTVEIRGLVGSSTVKLTPKDNAKFLRYAPDSVKFSEAKPSSIVEIAPGDMLRALGDRGTDGTTFAAEEVVSGAFQTKAGTVKSVDPAKGEVVISDLQTKQDITVTVTPTSVVKKFPEEFAQRMAQMGGGMRPGGQAPGGAPQGGQAQAGAPGQGGRPGGFGGGPRGGIDEMLDRFPNITVADLKPGDLIAVSSSKTSDNNIKAIKLLAGVEPFIRMAQMAGAAGQRQGGQRSPDFNIPGLDAVSMP
jgi:hypothetical protein